MLAGQVIICTTGSTGLVEKNELSALANKAFKVIVSCLTVWWIGQASTGLVYLKTGCQLWKLPSVMTTFFILLLSCPKYGCDFSCSVIQMCIQADVLIC